MIFHFSRTLFDSNVLCRQQTDRQTDVQIDRQTDRHTDRQTDRQTNRPTDILTKLKLRIKSFHYEKLFPVTVLTIYAWN